VANEPRGRLPVAAEQPVTLVDSSVILDVVTEDPAWAAWSADVLAQARDELTLCQRSRALNADVLAFIHDHRRQESNRFDSSSVVTR
jgi:hypothetical protein